MAAKKLNPWIGLVVTIVIPVVILTKFSGEESLGAWQGLGLALAFPMVYGLWLLAQAKRYDFYAILGVITVLLTGGIAGLRLDPKWLAVKEAAVPLAIGAGIIFSQRTKWPLVKTVLSQMVDIEGMASLAGARGKLIDFNRSLDRTAYIAAGSFLFSAILNYTLASLIVVSAPGTEMFNNELGKLTAWSYPAIALPSTLILVSGLFYLAKGLEKSTGLDAGELIQQYKKI